MTEGALHPIVEAAARGRFPEWARVSPTRLRHIEGVAALMDRWSRELALGEAERKRWRAVAFLHDALRDAAPASLSEVDDFPPKLRHGPAVAVRLEQAGVDDAELLAAIRYHTVGWKGWGELGRFLYLADFLEPGRALQPARQAALRARLPESLSDVLRQVCAWRLADRIRRGGRLWPESVDFWNSLRGKM